MRIAIAIIDDDFLLDAFRSDIQREMDHAVCIWLGGQHAQFQSPQTFACIAIADHRKVLHGGVINDHLVFPQTAFLVSQRLPDEMREVRGIERLEFENLRPGDQWTV